ncbi:hypothetical protein FIBSPDRAFT_962861 [Athelia psychrophila]|uniref:F-box domain-containing protein n=1 Tax=Athelia psychrophila TaxID=1759441 RepID=A0A165ZJJ4_9AGAM|nr:hypothetical protein FIBSPDRAFT_962861 [Fibularhizoctonia sp. CBS 109695]
MVQVGSIPVELWDQVLVSLPKVTQRECAFVCRSWRRVCRRALFTVVRLSTGNGTEADEMDLEAFVEAAKAWEILDCMGNDPTFAPVVKTIIVLKWRFGASVFETRSLQKALRAVPHLQSFQWLAWAGMPQEVLQTLHDDIPNLPELRLADPEALQSCELGQLRSIGCLVPQDFFDTEDLEVAQCSTIGLITANVDTLRELALDAMLSLPWNLPVRTFENLNHLTLVGLKDLRGLELVLRHSPNLENFIIEYKIDDELFSILAQNPSSAPLLSSFKVISGAVHDESHYAALGTFLQGHPRLRRLDIQMWAPIESAFIILPTVKALKDLTAFGLSVSCRPSPVDGIDYSCLPLFLSDDMEAVRFEVNLEEAVLDRGPLLPLMVRLAELPSLRYLSLQHHGDGELWPLAAEVGSQLKHLDCLSLDTSLWFIERASPPEMLASAWLPNKHILRLREDFAYQDAEWLARFVV